MIALWNDRPRRGFPGYGWLFPGPDGANLGLGVGLGHSRLDAHRAQQQLDAFRSHLVRIGLLGRCPTPADASAGRLAEDGNGGNPSG